MGVSPAKVTNDALLERPLHVDGDLPSGGISFWNNRYLENYENNNNAKYNNSNIKNISSSPYSELLIYHQNIRGLGNKMGEFETHVLPLLK
jgi:hypothetical protein